MTDNSTASAPAEELVDIDLETFEKDFYQKPSEDLKITDNEDDALETDEDTDAPAPTGDEDLANEDSEAEPEESDDPDEDADDKPQEEAEDKSKGKKSAYQKRIDELTRRNYETERASREREAALIRRIEEVEARTRSSEQHQPIQQHLPQGGPDPEAVNDKGDPVYPLGEYDPGFIRDLTRFTVETETAAVRQRENEARVLSEIKHAQNTLAAEWAEKVVKVEAEVPEIREHMSVLVDTFKSLDPAYGEYLAMTIMSSDNGVEIMDYLSQNIGEAQKIVASGPAAATRAIGRLEAIVSKEPAAKERQAKTVSHAPSPPESPTKGRKGQVAVRGDTNDLSAFEREFYGKK